MSGATKSLEGERGVVDRVKTYTVHCTLKMYSTLYMM